jgi:hypothetical protein
MLERQALQSQSQNLVLLLKVLAQVGIVRLEAQHIVAVNLVSNLLKLFELLLLHLLHLFLFNYSLGIRHLELKNYF